MIQRAKKEIFGHFQEFGQLDRFDIAYCDSIKYFSNAQQDYQVMEDPAKFTKMQFWMIQRPKNEVFRRSLEFGLLERLDIAYCDSAKCLSP